MVEPTQPLAVQNEPREEKKHKKDTRSRSWCVTQSAEKITLEELKEALKDYVYIGQKEKGEQGGEQGYEHYQIYIENPEPIRFSTLKNKLPNCHLEKRRGTKQEAYDYVTKLATAIGEPFGNGEIDLTEEQGKRHDVFRAGRKYKNGFKVARSYKH